MRVRAADEILHEQCVAVERGREEEARAVALEAFVHALRASDGACSFEDGGPVGLRVAPLQVLARGPEQPSAVLLEVEALAETFEPLEEGLARGLLPLVDLKAPVLRRQLFGRRFARRRGE